jgi:zinc protease
LLGSFDVYEGDWKRLFDSPALYEKVTREDVQKAAALVFQKNRRTVGLLQSPPEAPATAAPAATEAKP